MNRRCPHCKRMIRVTTNNRFWSHMIHEIGNSITDHCPGSRKKVSKGLTPLDTPMTGVEEPIPGGDYPGSVKMTNTHISIPDDWQPTGKNINNLPDPIRKYIASIETLCDPGYLVQENAAVREENSLLRLKIVQITELIEKEGK